MAIMNSSHKEVNQMQQCVMLNTVTDSFSEKKSLIRKRLIPLIISLLILGAAVAVHLLVPVPSSHENGSVGNDMFINGFNMTSNTTQNR